MFFQCVQEALVVEVRVRSDVARTIPSASVRRPKYSLLNGSPIFLKIRYITSVNCKFIYKIFITSVTFLFNHQKYTRIPSIIRSRRLKFQPINFALDLHSGKLFLKKIIIQSLMKVNKNNVLSIVSKNHKTVSSCPPCHLHLSLAL